MLTKIKRENLIIIYKLLNDTLFIGLVFFLLALIGEGLLPGIITFHIGFSKIITVVFFNLAAVYLLANQLGIKADNDQTNKKTAYLLLFIVLLLVFNSLLKANIFFSLFILLVVVLIGIFIYKVIFEEN
ncbi:MAG TPA: hypothetical protein PLK35_04170 [Candidatus Moranbacteria bacterium]|nr:hypothetical protein [Candidatus Moranbacteria bacterium]